MSEPRETDERLRRWLNGDQPARERMCLAVLALDRSYTQIEPRRPEGGPDGARDMQAVRNGQPTWGAVGFVNSATDSQAEKRQIKKKFCDDLRAARKAKPDLNQFVFITNVDLRPSEVAKLKQFAIKLGLTWVEVYWREVLRARLDSVEGLAIRFQYLRVPLSEEEQISFFNHYGQSLAELVTTHHVSLRAQLDRLEFLHWSVRQIRDVQLTLSLDRWYRPPELGHVRAIAKFRQRQSSQPFLIIGGRDDCRGREGATMKPAWHFKSFVWHPELQKAQVISYDGIWHESPHVTFGVGFAAPIGVTIESFDGALITIYLNKGLHERVHHFQVSVNGYAVFEQVYNHAPFRKYAWPEATPDMEFPVTLSEEEAAIPWVSHEFFPWMNFEKTPRRANESLISIRPDFA